MEDIRQLFDKYSKGTCRPDELDKLLAYIREHSADGALEELVRQEMEADDLPNDLPDHLERMFAGNRDALGTRIQGTTVNNVNYTQRRRWLVAASIIFLLSACYLLYKLLSNEQAIPHDSPKTGQVDILPASNRAILILADGRSISLDDAKTGTVASESNINISKTADGELLYQLDNSKTEHPYITYNTLRTPNGGRFKITLPDGTLVWLNAGSSLTYPVHFASNERRVKVTGEAYFEVAKKGAGQAFIVECKGQQVEVLGTHFNINAYDNEPMLRTTLVEGKVAVKSGEAIKILRPGEQSSSFGNKLIVEKVDTEEFIAWKDNLFVFHGADLGGIFRQVERWYDVKFEYQKLPAGIKMYGELPRDIELSGLLTTIEKNTGLKFTIKGRRIIVEK